MEDHLSNGKIAGGYKLVGGFNHLETYKSMGRIIPYNKEKMLQTTNQ